ncbi:MAG: hypothetical protein J5858_10165, partial [Lentisphaeria bacterium]|nr:hypothetical protein [Lentisphaeria bacterium]
MSLPADKVLIGNSFPLVLIRRRVTITPVPEQVVRQRLCSAGKVVSFWGHLNTLPAAEAFLGIPLTPARDRPAISLDEDQFPVLDGKRFTECFVLSPDYRNGFRPSIGQEVPLDQIAG